MRDTRHCRRQIHGTVPVYSYNSYFLSSLLQGNPGAMAYSTSKAAVIGMAKATGKEYAETGITVNALAPAVVMTPLVEGTDPAVVKSNTDKIAMKR